MKSKVDQDEEGETGQEGSTVSDEENNSKEPWIKNVSNNLSQAISRKNVFLTNHRMATS